MKYDLIHVVRCKDANDFLDCLSPFGRVFRELQDLTGWWVFRGHGSHKFQLEPSAFRRDCQLTLAQLAGIDDWDSKPYLRNDGRHTLGAQWYVEALALQSFLAESDKIGLEFPDDSMTLRSKLFRFVEDYRTQLNRGFVDESRVSNTWIPYDLLAFAGIAQHHRVPTRLLDWSLSPYAAAYFAASDSIQFRESNDANNSSEFHVYSLLASSLERLPENVDIDLAAGIPNFSDVLFKQESHIKIVSVPRASNRNFRAQNGVFTLLAKDREEGAYLGAAFVPGSYEAALEGLVHKANDFCPLLFKFILPASEAYKLLWILEKLGVNHSSLFPSFDGAAKSMLDAVKIRKAVLGRKP